MKFLIAVPCMDTLPVAFVESLMSMDKPKDTHVRFLPGSLVYDARNLLCVEAFKDNYDYIMWIDSDMVVPKDALANLLVDTIDKNAQIFTGLYVKRTYPTVPVLYDKIEPPALDDNNQLVKQIHEYTDYPLNDTFKVAGCGFGCVLTSVKLLKRVWDTFGPAFNPLPWASEDIAFCYRVGQLHEPIWCDSNISCGHIGTLLYTDKMLKRGDTH